MHILKRPLLVTLLLLTAAGSQAQWRTRRTTAVKDTVSAFVRSYTDSLTVLRARIDSSRLDVQATDSRFARLFMPPTFYHDVASRSFSIEGETPEGIEGAVDKALVHTYLNRPSLLTGSDNRLRKAGSLRDTQERPAPQKMKLAEKVEPMPDEPFVPMPEGLVVRKPNFWTYSGDGHLQFLQNFISNNWYKGGESNYSMVGDLTLNANYDNKSKIKWENKLELKLGFQTSRSDTVHKFKTNNDLIRYTGKFGLQAYKQWYYTLQLLAYTQFTQGLKSNDKKVYSDFMSPFNLNLGLGMDYKVSALQGRLKGDVNISLLSFNFRYVDRKDLAKKYGVIGDHHTLEDFGSQLTCNLTWKICDQVQWKTRLYAYTTYHRSEVEWENTLTLSVSKYISATLFLYPRFDDSTDRDDKLGYLQFKEYSALGFSYSF